MATVRKMWRCTNTDCKNDKGKHRGYKKVCLGEKKPPLCKHCSLPMTLSENYTTRIVSKGETYNKSISPRKGDAEAHIAACVVARNSGGLMPGAEPMIMWRTAVETFTKWIDAAEANKEISDKTALYYKNGLKPLEASFKKSALQDIEKQHVEDFKTDRKRQVSASTVNMSLSALKRMFTVITDQLQARKYPRLHEAKTDVFKVKLLELDNANDIILETEEEMQALLAECKTKHLHHFVFGVLNTGLRHADMLTLKTTEISFPNNRIVKLVKGKKQVSIPLTGQYRAYLETWLKCQRLKSINHYVIPSRLKPSECYRVDGDIGFATACENAAVKFERQGKKAIAKKFRQLTPHHLRHTFATHFIYKNKGKGKDVVVHILSKILGHSGLYITERYSHALESIQQEAMTDFGNEMFGEVM
jgi:integrase